MYICMYVYEIGTAGMDIIDVCVCPGHVHIVIYNRSHLGSSASSSTNNNKSETARRLGTVKA